MSPREQVICHGKANQKYRLILVFKPFLLVSMIQGFQKSWEIQQLLEIMDFVRGFNLTAAFLLAQLLTPSLRNFSSASNFAAVS